MGRGSFKSLQGPEAPNKKLHDISALITVDVSLKHLHPQICLQTSTIDLIVQRPETQHDDESLYIDLLLPLHRRDLGFQLLQLLSAIAQE